jgi:hypothetical protein
MLPARRALFTHRPTALLRGRHGYYVAMRRLLIGLTLTLLLVVSIGVGVVVARWPQLWP